MQTCRPHKFRRFRQSFDDRPYFGEPLFVPFYISLNADISGTRKDIKKRSTVFCPVFPVLSYKKIKIFHFVSTLSTVNIRGAKRLVFPLGGVVSVDIYLDPCQSVVSGLSFLTHEWFLG